MIKNQCFKVSPYIFFKADSREPAHRICGRVRAGVISQELPPSKHCPSMENKAMAGSGPGGPLVPGPSIVKRVAHDELTNRSMAVQNGHDYPHPTP